MGSIMRSETDDSFPPAFSVIVPAYNGGGRAAEAFSALAGQRFAHPFEVIVVDSGPLSVSQQLRKYHPDFRIIRSERKLGPGQARNAGIRVARGRYIAFCSVDTPPIPHWLAERYAEHQKGFAVVAGSIANGTPRHPVGLAGYLLEYSALVPCARVLRRQAVPHALSFERSLLARLGPYPEDVLTGEDTIVNERCVRAGIPLSFAPRAAIVHRNPTSLVNMLSHAHRHGRGLAQCMDQYDHRTAVASHSGSRPWRDAYEFLLVYPLEGLAAKWARLGGRPKLQSQLVVLSPLVLLGSIATGMGVLVERRRQRQEANSLDTDGSRQLPRAWTGP